MTDDQIAEVRNRYAAGEPTRSIAKAMGISDATTIRAAFGQRPYGEVPGAVMPRGVAKGPPSCHPDRKYHSGGLCAQCYQLQFHYGLEPGSFDRMFADQGGGCLICARKQRFKRLNTDHDHVTKRVRGLLCTRCNRGVGMFEWSIPVMRRLIAYVESIISDREANGSTVPSRAPSNPLDTGPISMG